MNLNIEEISKIDLTELSKHLHDDEARAYFLRPEGEEHYKLLAWLSNQFVGINIADIGTYKGASALALSYNKTNLVNTYDVSDMYMVSGEENIYFTIIPADHMAPKWLDCSLIMLDTVHDGIHERAVIDWLIENKWKGILILDDIGGMFPGQKRLWEDITSKKVDISEYGHWAGSGLIYFD